MKIFASSLHVESFRDFSTFSAILILAAHPREFITSSKERREENVAIIYGAHASSEASG